MATVYLAHDQRHDRPVALKVLRPEVSGALGSERFAREIAIAGRLSHPHILPIHDSGTLEVGNGVPGLYYTMPYVDGKSLRHRLDGEPQLPMEEAVGIARQVAEALDHAHRQGIVHRDIKPENILLAEGNALVADFGIARALDSAGGERLTETGLALGTPAYMSPEQGTGSARVDGRADIYALGCVLYEMLAGQPPFTGPTAQAILARHAMDPVPSLRTVRATVGPGLARTVTRALAKVPADRYPTARALADALAVPEPSWTSQAVTPVISPRATTRRWAPIAVAVALTVLVGGAVALVARGKSNAPVATDPSVVAIAPFRVSSADSSLRYLRDGMVDLLAGKLGGTLVLRPADARAMTSAWRRAADAGGDVSEQAALSMAGRLGAGRLVEGEVVGSGRNLTISALLADVPGGRVRARAAVEGPSDSLTPLVDQLAGRLLALSIGEPERRLPGLTSASPSALRAYLDGRVLLRRNEFMRAEQKFAGALAADSSFALAGLGLVRANYEGFFDPIGSGARAAWALRDRLSPQDRAELELLLGSRYPVPDPPGEAIRTAERFTQLAPDNPDAWYLYGAHLCVDGALQGEPDARERCKSAYGRALALDSGSTLIATAFTRIAAELEDTAAMRRGLRLVTRTDSTSASSVSLQWHVATVLGDTATARALALSDSMISTRADGWSQYGPWAAARVFLHQGLGNRDLDLVLTRSLEVAPTDDQRWSLETMEYFMALMRGRSTGLALPRRYGGTSGDVARVLDAVFSDGDPAPAVPAAAALERELGRPIEGGCCLDRFALAEYALGAGRLSVAQRAVADMQAYRSTGPDSADENAVARAYWLIVDAQVAARQRVAATAEKLGRLDSMLVNLGAGWERIPIFGNLIAARLHAEREEFGPALEAIRRRDYTRAQYPTFVLYHREEGRIAAVAGDTAGAIRAYERYLRIRAEAEPRLQMEVRTVRAELATLTR